MKKFVFILFSLILFVLCNEVEGRRGGGGGGGRGGGSRGGGGWSIGKGSSSKGGGFSSKGGGWTTKGGRNVIGTYKTFGTPNRWSVYHGRSYYFVGYPFGHRHYYYGSSHRRGSDPDDDDDWSPWTIMILVLVGINLTGLLTWIIVLCRVKN